ncbi:MAG: DNA polymerase III subunit beta [Acidobacteria bacterium]|nr:DNA polymerase III subunit beta [Acidobacteriota bacterium]MBV9475827.1 DNA polymerase III subunit beta [Acidobacteriota bacterium]
MELTVGKADLQKELQLCQGVVEKRSTIPILSNVLLKAADGRLQIAATDLDVTILSSCAARITTPGGVTIEAKRLFDIVRSLPDDDVHITLQDNNSVAVESGTAKFRLLGLPAEDYPTLPTVNVAEGFSIPLGELKTMVAKVKFAITHEETRFQLNGALLKVQPNKMEMVATDGHRMALINFPASITGGKGKKGSDLTILIPRKALDEILRLEADASEDAVRFGVSDNQLFFEAGDRRLLARMIDVNFPNYMEVISRDNDRHVMVDRERLLSTIKRISLVANERTRAVRFDFAPGKLTVSSTNPELGDARETVPIDYAGQPFFVGLNAAYVMDFLSATDTPSVSLDLKDENSQCIGKPASTGEDLPYDYLYVVMPMRLA